MTEAVFAFAGKAVATKVISTIISKDSYLDELLKGGGMEDIKARLMSALPQIESVLTAVNEGRIREKNEPLDQWLWQFRDAVEEAEDVLDELEYYKLEEKVKTRDSKLSATVYKCKQKSVNIYDRILNAGTLKKLTKVVKGLDTVAAGVVAFLDLVRGLGGISGGTHGDLDGIVASRETSPLLTENVVFGRDKERDEVVDWLIKPVGDEHEAGGGNVFAFTIYGIGGLGKTTLAKLIYNDERVKNYFDETAWVCISDRFNVKVITKGILEAITNESPMVHSLVSLQNILKEKLISKKFFIVLDDVWDDKNTTEWETLMAPLGVGLQGSKILVTTRMESVADMVARVIGRKKEFLKLGGLEENHLLDLFNKYAFFGASPDEHNRLQPLGMRIVRELRGCPLLAKVIGGMLNSCRDDKYWNKIWKDEVSRLQAQNNSFLAVLKLSYDNLRPHLQACFRYCSLFSQDYRFHKDKLIKMWMGSGLIHQSTQQRPEDVGEGYFNHLVRKSFFESTTHGTYYVMHDLLHELSRVVSLGECLRIEGSCVGNAPKTVRHLSGRIESLQIIGEIANLKNLRSLVIELKGNCPKANYILSKLLKKLKNLRLLRLTTDHKFVLPDSIGNLIHLRYISVEMDLESYTERKFIDWFPRSVHKLYHIQLVAFRGRLVLKKIQAKGWTNLINLRYLEVNCDISIPFIGKLTSLREICVFKVSKKKGHNITELKELRDLHKLSVISLKDVKSSKEAKEVRLNERENLTTLDLRWSRYDEVFMANDMFTDDELLDNLQPNACLEELTINKYRGTRSPFWLTDLYLVKLTNLVLVDCKRWECLPPLGMMPSLIYLQIMGLSAIKEIGRSFYGSGIDCVFRSLKELLLFDMPSLEKWVEVQDRKAFPNLERLRVDKCPKLRALPVLPVSLRELRISSTGIFTVPEMCQGSCINNGAAKSKSLLVSLNISDCKDLTSPNGLLRQQLQNLEHLVISGCKNLLYMLAGEWLPGLTSLKELELRDCPLLLTDEIQGKLLPSTLKKLSIINCGLDALLPNSWRCLTSLTYLELYSCSNVMLLPSSEVLSKLTTLHTLYIRNCRELSSLGGLGDVISLKNLTITGCDKLIALASLLANDGGQGDMVYSSLNLERLEIDHRLLCLEPLRSLRVTKELDFYADSELTALPEQWLLQNCTSLYYLRIYDAKSLQNLPPNLAALSSLQELRIRECPLMESLPQLPASLRYLDIYGGHLMLKQYKTSSISCEFNISTVDGHYKSSNKREKWWKSLLKL